MDGEPKPISKGSLVEAYLTKEEVASPIVVIGPTNTNSLRKLKPIFKSTQGVSIQPTHLLKGMKSLNLSRVETKVSSFIGSPLDDNSVSSSLDLTLDIVPHSFTKPLNQSID